MRKLIFRKKKIPVIFLWLAGCSTFFYSGPLYAFNTDPDILQERVSLTVDNQSLKYFLNIIEQQLEIKFVYSESRIDLNKKISRKFNREPLENVLHSSLPGSVGYAVSGRNIILKPRMAGREDPIGKGVIIGNIKGKDNDEVLPYATVVIRGTSKGAVADESGNFRFSGLDEGVAILEVTYVGYEKQEKEIIIRNGETGRADFILTPLFDKLEGVTVTGIRRGEVKALSQMKAAENIKYVMSREQMERFPDITLSESLQRVPGVAVGYSYGLARDIIIRGLGQGLSSITINGTRLPSTSAGSRTTDLNGVLSDVVEAVEVVKTLTPDMDADGTGGTVNIITKSPPLNSRTLDAKASVGYNNLVDKANYEIGATYGQRLKKTGFVVGANYLRTWRGEDRVEKGYDMYEFDGREQLMLGEYDLTGYMIKRDNAGINAEFDYYPDDNSRYYIRGSYNKYYEIQNRLRRITGIGEYASVNQISGIRVSQFGNWRDYHRDLTVISLGGKTSFSSWNVDFDLTYSGGNYDQPIYYNATFERNGMSGVLDVSNPRAPQIDYTEADPYDPSQYTTSRYINRHDSSRDHDAQLTFNISKSYTIGDISGELKFGGRFRYKYNDRSRNYFLHDLKEGEFVLADYLSGYRKDDHFDNNYVLDNFPDAETLDNFYQNNKNLFADNETYTHQNTDPDSFFGNEYLGAGYVMTKLNFNNFEVVGGVRYEQTGFHYKGNQVNFDEDGNYLSTRKVDSDKTFDGFFPSLNIKYTFKENTNFRFAVTRSLSRPGYYDLVPWEEVLNSREEINMGNPGLTQATSVNCDLLFEHYFQSVGLISGGVFYKKIKNYLYESNYIQEGGTYDGWEVEQVVNGASATVKGLELSWQQQLTFLPGFLNGLGIYANYTYVDSKMEVPGIEQLRTVKLPEMRPHVGNISLSYEKYGFSGRVSMYFYDTYITELGSNADQDELERGRKQIDISASQQLNKKWSVFVSLSNITNAPISFKFGNGRPFDDMYYSSWGNLGIRFNLN